MNNKGSKRFNSDGSRNAYLYSTSRVVFDEKSIQEELNIPLVVIVNSIIFFSITFGLFKILDVKNIELPNFLDIPTIMCTLVFIFFYFFCFELLIRKTGSPWWGVFIPIYNIYLLLKLAFVNPIRGIIPFIVLYFGLAFIIWYLPQTPYVEYLFLVRKISNLSVLLFPAIYMYKLGTNFNRSGLLMLMLWFVLIPTTAFSSLYDYNNGKNYF